MHIRIVDDQKLKDVKYLFSNTEREAPVEVDQTYEVTIDDLAREGDGIARVEGFVIFVPDTQVGDNVTIKVTKVMRKFAFGEKVE